MPSLQWYRSTSSRADPFRKGVDIFLGVTNCDLCPVAALLVYLVICQTRFGPIFVFKDDSLLTCDKLVSAVQSALSQTRVVTSRFSFRIGAATSAAQAGLEDSLIRCWVKGIIGISEIYTCIYVCTPRESLAAVSRTLVHIT